MHSYVAHVLDFYHIYIHSVRYTKSILRLIYLLLSNDISQALLLQTRERIVVERQGEQGYLLRLEMLLLVLQAHQHTGDLWATLPAGTLPLPGNSFGKGKIAIICQAELLVVSGQVHRCLIRDLQRSQIVIEGKPALDLLQQGEELFWVVRPTLEDVASPARDYDEGSLTPPLSQERGFLRSPPRLLRPLRKRELDALPHRHRHVLLLVNGQRGVEDFCRMLSCSREQLLTVLDELEADHFLI
jgi:hypothetical protein